LPLAVAVVELVAVGSCSSDAGGRAMSWARPTRPTGGLCAAVHGAVGGWRIMVGCFRLVIYVGGGFDAAVGLGVVRFVAVWCRQRALQAEGKAGSGQGGQREQQARICC
jgi:hypothetical protein